MMMKYYVEENQRLNCGEFLGGFFEAAEENKHAGLAQTIKLGGAVVLGAYLEVLLAGVYGLIMH